MGRLRGVMGRLGGDLGRLGCVLGGLEVSWALQKLQKPMKNHHVAFWYPLGSWAVLWRLGGVLGASWRLFGPSWGRLGGVLGRLGSVLGPCWAVLRASWVRLGASENPGMLKSEKTKYYSDSKNRALNTILAPKTGRPVLESEYCFSIEFLLKKPGF